MPPDEDLIRQLMESFHEELAERLAAINAALLALEQRPAAQQRTSLLEELFRNVHSLKGAARAVDLKPIEELAHGMEDVFGAAKRGSISLTPDLFDLLYQGLDLIGAGMASVDSGQGIPASMDLPGYLVRLASSWRSQPVRPPHIEEVTIPKEPERPVEAAVTAAPPPISAIESAPQPWAGDTVRVPTSRLDDLMAQAGELLVTRLRAARQVEQVRDLHEATVRWLRDWQRTRSSFSSMLQDTANGSSAQLRAFLQRNEEHLRTLTTQLSELSRQLADDAARLAFVTNGLQDGIKRTRMLPLATLLAPLRRTIRDLARDKGVEVSFQVRGADTEMDKHVLEQIRDPLLHLVRNCIDHGIELPKERERLGKPRRGTITLNAERVGNTIIVEVSDDGAGIDTQAVRDAAIHRGLISSEEAADMTDDQVRPFIFAPGLSTSTFITEISGRGIGLDVVRKNVEMLQGGVEVHSSPGQGTTLALSLPLTLVSTRCLLLRAAGSAFAVALSAVERILPIGPEDIATVEGREAIRYRGRPIALVRLARLLRLPDSPPPALDKLPAVVLSAGGQPIAFLIDDLAGEQEIVVKSLGKQLARVPNVAGAAVLGTGRIVLILNVADLVKSAQQSGTAQRPSPSATEGKEADERRRSILVVDDSITTRTLEKNILTTAGYEVRLAIDGEEALLALADNDCDLVVSDIDMPRMDGFELTLRIKEDERHRELPVILVTSLESSEDKARGIEVGADAYIVKSTFDQDNLLETIRQLI